MNKLHELAIQHSKATLWGVLVITLLVGALISQIKIDTDPENMLPHDQPERLVHDEIKKRFSLHDMIVVGVVNNSADGIFNPSTLNNIEKITSHINDIDGVIQKDLMSLSNVDNITQEGPGTIRFQWMMKQAPTNSESAKAIREAVNRLPLFHNTLVAETGKAAAIYVPIKAKDLSHQISKDIESFTNTLIGEDQFHITGLPVAEDTFGVEMFIQMAISAPLAALVIFLLMWYFFKSFALVSAPMLVAMSTVIITMGFMIGSGFTVHIMSSMIPIFLMPIAVVDSIHILSEFAELHKPGDDPKKTIRTVLNNLFTPMLFTSTTSSIGFASLAFTPIPPVQIFGLYVAFGIFLAFFLTITFIPAYIVRLSPETIEKLAKSHDKQNESPVLHSILGSIKRFSLGNSKLIILVGISVLATSFYGISKIQINDNPVRWFKENHKIRVADKELNEHFAGTYSAFLVLSNTTKENITNSLIADATKLAEQHSASDQLNVFNKLVQSIENEKELYQSLPPLIDDHLFENSPSNETFWVALIEHIENLAIKSKYFQSPENLAYIEKLQEHLINSGLIGKANALPDVVKTVYRELKGGKQEHFQVPSSSKGIAEALLSYQSSHRPDDLWHFVTPDFNSTAIWLQLKSGDNIAMSKVISSVEDFFSANPLPKGVTSEWGGLTYINVIWQEEMVNGMLESLLSAFVIVLIMMIILFRSVLFGLLAMIPLTLTITMIYGLIGFIGKEYDMPVAVLSALTLGLSVDFAIHFLERLRSIYKETGNWEQTIKAMFDEPALAITRNAIVISVGFLPLLAAPLVPYNTVGFFLAAIMAISAIATLVILTALINIIRKVAL